MRKLSLLFVAILSVSLLAGCTMPMTAPVYGGLVTSDVSGPIAMGDASVACTKTGVAKAEGIVCVAWGDASIKAAMDQGGITKVHHVDVKCMSVLGIYTKTETIVYGE